MRKWMMLATVAAACSVAPAASAVELRDDHAHFALDPTLEGTDTCVVFPKRDRDAESCKGVELAAFSELAQDTALAKTVGVTVSIADSWRALVFVRRSLVGKLDLDSKAGMRAAILGLRETLANESGLEFTSHGRKGADWDSVSLGDVRAARVVLEPADAATVNRTSLLSTVAYLIEEDEGFHAVMFMTDAAHLALVEKKAAAAMETLKLDHQRGPEERAKKKQALEDSQRNYEAGRRAGQVIGAIVAAGFVIWLVSRAARGST
jgi:hypothetical protein